MVQSDAKTVEDYLADLPEDRRDAIEAVRHVILDNLPEGIVETMNWGMISYDVPLDIHPDTYNDKPLMFAALASQKRHMSVYLSAIYADPDLSAWFRYEYEKSGKKMDIGKSCVRFRTLDDVPLDLVGEAIGKVTIDEFVGAYEAR